MYAPARWRALAAAARGRGLLLAVVVLAAVAVPGTADAYVGPGAGFAFVSSFLVLFSTIFIVMASLLIWPFRVLWRALTRRADVKPKIKRFIVCGFDGQDPQLTDRFMAEGKLPNFEKLAKMGCYKPLKTTFPALSPVAWSSFATGTRPARHNIYDFLDRDRRTYLPVLSSTKIGSVDKFLKLGPFRIPLESPEIRLLRKSKPFWTILGEHNIWSTVVRVPITFPPDRFYGAQLSAMCTPDLLGTQGTFLLFTTRPADDTFKEGGMRVQVEMDGDRVAGTLQGPENMLREGNPPLEIAVKAELDRGNNTAEVHFGDESVRLELNELSDWISLTFNAAPMVKVRGIARVMMTEMNGHFSLYMTPIAIDPEKPAMPISHPSYYSVYLAKMQGKYSTLGLAEDTWALNEEVIEDRHFRELALDIDDERKEMFFTSLSKLRKGSLTCVFDATDRIQHMYWRYIEKGHPADDGSPSDCRDAIEEIYVRNDKIVGELLEKIGPDDLLMVLSDHGFTSFRRGVNLNRWLLDNGYLHLKDGTDGSSEWLRDVDWSRTKAYCLGLSGMFFNIKGRESEGIVEPGDVDALKEEIADKLRGLRDDEHDEVAINEAFDTKKLYSGPYLENAPEFVLGYNRGYRTSWDCATGVVKAPLFEDNVKAWSGDHCVDPRLVPGVLFCSRDIDIDDPALIDIAPTALQQFGIEPPKHMDGKVLFKDDAKETTA